ncbi:MAG TPA: ATP-binding protein [Gemmatimonadaceae bacterium]|nr:ATP-binding protein [Gemmatimonadaceae bacterium]
MHGSFDPALVALSLVIGVLASYTALDLASGVAAASGRRRLAWIGGGAAALGIGFWTVHFVAMLALRLPIPTLFHAPLMGVSVLVAVAATAIALYAVSGPTDPSRLAAAALVMGIALAAMDYIGLAALRIPVTVHYDHGLVLASVAIAIAAACIVLWLALRLRTGESARSWWRKAAGATTIGIAIAGVQYTGLAAARFLPGPGRPVLTEGDLLASTSLAVFTVVATLVILGLALGGMQLDRSIRAAAAEAALLRERARLEAERSAILRQMTDGVMIADPSGRITFVNDAARRMHGDAAPGVTVEEYAAAKHLYTPAGMPYPPHLLPLVRAARHGETVTDVEVRIRPAGGRQVIVLMGAAPVQADDGSRIGAVLVIRDVTAEREIAAERAALLEVTEAARAAAEAASASKSSFLATMSHELRTPLNAILGYTELLEMQLAGPITDAQRGYLGRVRESGRHLLGLISEVLDIARIEAGRMSVGAAEGRIAPPLEAAIALTRPSAAARGIELTLRCGDPASLRYVGDEARVRQVLVNLLANAVKFTPERGRVTVDCGIASAIPGHAAAPPDARWVHIDIRDTGVGIAHELHEAVFEPFMQVESGPTRTRSGSGLGLSISRQLARLMGGDITLESTPGVGSTFTLWLCAPVRASGRLPDGALPGAAREMRAGVRAIGERLTAGVVDEIAARMVERLRSEEGIPAARGRDDTVVEDHMATFLREITQLLAFSGVGGEEPADFAADGTEIQRVISERHGAQRFRYGWSEMDVEHEFRILGEEVESAVRRAMATSTGDTSERAVEIIRGTIERARDVSLRGYRMAASTAPRG